MDTWEYTQRISLRRMCDGRVGSFLNCSARTMYVVGQLESSEEDVGRASILTRWRMTGGTAHGTRKSTQPLYYTDICRQMQLERISWMAHSSIFRTVDTERSGRMLVWSKMNMSLFLSVRRSNPSTVAAIQCNRLSVATTAKELFPEPTTVSGWL